jgi:hypothetical protein
MYGSIISARASRMISSTWLFSQPLVKAAMASFALSIRFSSAPTIRYTSWA